jgi:RNA polymerase sigma-70 factor (ECF subfamily)
MNPEEEGRIQTELTVAHNDYEKGLNVHGFFKLHNHATGEDLVQETFMKTWAYLAKGGKIEIMKAFLYHVLNNLIIDEYRKGKHKTSSLDNLMEKGFKPKIDDYERLFKNLDSKEALLLIDDLPQIYQEVIQMKYIQELSTQEMSIITGHSKNSITVQAHRGLIKLRFLYNKKLR